MMADVLVMTCAAGDDVCFPSCVGTDSDCITTCGDTRCVGNSGELCGNCMTDCAIPTGCGNGACEIGVEDGTTCPADCGPMPWSWTADEQALETEINNRRVGGVTCPGDGSPRFASALAVGPALLRLGAREYAWEIAHHQYYPGNSIACNGRTFAQRQTPFGGNGGASYNGLATTTVTAVVNSWAANMNLCPVLMATNRTQFGVAVAHDAGHAFVMWQQ